MNTHTAMAALVEKGFVIEKEGIRLFKNPKDDFPYTVDVSNTIAKGRVANGTFSTMEQAIPCFVARCAALRDLHAKAVKRLERMSAS